MTGRKEKQKQREKKKNERKERKEVAKEGLIVVYIDLLKSKMLSRDDWVSNDL